jgi:bifunctional UDP-N-acetylglucosamine pyrophosphorylase / glucosamine-1-phosphate N-acetyltransferase
MDIRPRCYDKVVQLIEKGVDIANPLTIDIGEEVDIGRISGNGVRIYPGTRIYGDKTVISSGARIGHEGPATLDNCQLGPGVTLKGGYFSGSVFLEKASMGLGAHVREGCILEEEASGAHCVGMKQTILFPFVTLGSLINFCDCLMAGGTSRKDHSEVGSSYIHFNFTPDGDKTTPSLIGDVPRGVMLNQPAIFLGGQGGMVGPVRMGYGNVVAANSVIRNDYLADNKLIIGKTHPAMVIDINRHDYPNIGRIVENNVVYIANLNALEEWYIHVRRPFLERGEFGGLIFSGLIEKLALARDERLKRLEMLAQKAWKFSVKKTAGKQEFYERFAEIASLFNSGSNDGSNDANRDAFLSRFSDRTGSAQPSYIAAVKGLDEETCTTGVRWLQGIVDGYCTRARATVPSLNIFR